ncbi:MAG: response regulator transcription factor [Rhodospirillaceae bacterium]|nr:response regulator transcription factor [Rhodospirillaceae bacterium]
MKILLVDDHAVVRKGVIDILSARADPPTFDEAETSRGALHLLSENPEKYDLTILDLHLPDESGFETIRKMRELSCKLPILILSMYDAAEYAVRAFQAGANAYVTKGSVPEELHHAIEMVLDGKTFLSEQLIGQFLTGLDEDRNTASGTPGLSERETTVLRLLAKGERITTIGTQLGLSPKTVATYRARGLSKLGLANNAELVRYAYKNGILPE